ncbi:MAG: hypothetical protein ACJ768_17610, partial [Gaiellaceae bacterium]
MQARHARLHDHGRGVRPGRGTLRPGPPARRRAGAHPLLSELAAVLGFPVGHSLSPVMHNAAFAALGLDWHYVKLPVPPERFDETVRALPASGYRG